MEKSDKDITGFEYNEVEKRYYSTTDRELPRENYLVSFFGRMNYSLMDKYLLTATLRRDGSSRFSKNNRWGLFPSAAFAWTVSNEKFMESAQSFLSNLKIRLGYGITGQQEIGDYMYLTKYKVSTDPHSTYLGHYLMSP